MAAGQQLCRSSGGKIAAVGVDVDPFRQRVAERAWAAICLPGIIEPAWPTLERHINQRAGPVFPLELA